MTLRHYEYTLVLSPSLNWEHTVDNACRSVRKRISTLVTLMFLAACTESPTELESTRLAASGLLLAANVQTGEVVTLYDAWGTSFTLDVNHREIRRGDGLVVELTAEETAEAATAFHTISAGDYLVAALESSPPPNTDCPKNEPSCVQPYSGGGGANGSSTVSMRLVSSESVKRRGGRFGSRIISRGGSKHRPSKPGNDSTVEIMSSGAWPPSCLDIARAIYEKMPEYNESRRVYLNVLKEGWPPISWEGGSPRFKLKDWPELAIALGAATYRLQSSELQLNVMAGLYTGYGCWNDSWQDVGGPGSGSGSGSGGSLGGGGGYRLACYDEMWEISFDGGATWGSIKVSVCDWEATM